MEIHDLIEKRILPQIRQPIWENWYIKERIGSGAFSTVFRLEAHTSSVDERALKISAIVSDRPFETAEGRMSYLENQKRMAENESLIMKKLDGCPHIVRYYDEKMERFSVEGEVQGYYNLISMELLTPLPDTMRNKTFSCTEENVLRLACEIGEALQYAHNRSVIHRDVKPENLFVTEEGIYKLGDFNVSKRGEAARSMAGSPSYMAPEIFYAKSDPDEVYTRQADIYSFGICLYQMMNDGFFPLEDADTPEEIAVELRRNGENLPPPRKASVRFGTIILKACAHDVNQRYASMDDMLTELKALRDAKNNSTIYADDSIPTPISASLTPVRKNSLTKTLVWIMSVMLFVAACMLVWLLWNLKTRDNPPDKPSKPETVPSLTTSGFVNSGQVEYVGLYSSPDDESTMLARLYSGESIEVYALEGNWYHIRYGSMEGYVKAVDVSFTPLPSAEEIENTEVPTEAPTVAPTEVSTKPVYTFVNGKYTWEEAERYCEERGGHLATIHSQEDWDALITVVNQAKQTYSDLRFIWLGATSSLDENMNLSFAWVDNSETYYIMNSSHWYYNSRLDTWEPSGYDIYEYRNKGNMIREPYLLLWNLSSSGKVGSEWTLNDVPDVSGYDQYKSSNMGFVMQTKE